MTKNVMTSVLDAINWHNELQRLQALLEICLEQVEDTEGMVGLRVDLLVSNYIAQAELCLNELDADLANIQKQLATQKELQENWLLWRMLIG